MHAGDDAAALHVRVEQTACCYMEGAVRVVQLDGPTSGQWAVEEASDARLAPGEYTVTAFEQVCNGNCGLLAAPSNHCSLDVRLADGESVELVVTFPVPGACTLEVASGS
jgi:hypothetical protein